MTGGMDFSAALRALRSGHRVARSGWNGKGMWLALVRPPPFRFCAAPPLRSLPPGEVTAPYYSEARVSLPETLIMRTADGGFVAWLASQTDILAEDWRVLNEAEPT